MVSPLPNLVSRQPFPTREEEPMNSNKRRVAPRMNLRIPLRFRPITIPTLPEQRAETLNLSQNGVFFATDYHLTVCSPVELLLKMPRELTGKESSEVLCNARVVDVEPVVR